MLKVDDQFVDGLDPLGPLGEPYSVSGLGVPRADCSQFASVVNARQVFQHRSVVYERVYHTVWRCTRRTTVSPRT